MTGPSSPSRWVLVVGLALGVAVAAGCTAGPTPQAAQVAEEGVVADAPLADDTVTLTVYYRAGEGPTAHLEAVQRDVPVTDDLPRRALELLLAGPAPSDGGLAPPLPTSTRILGLEVDGDGTALVDLSAEVIEDAQGIGGSAANEALALAALTNTLTELGSVEQVVLRVEGRSSEGPDGLDVAGFWGGWGLPDVLVRDESVVGPAADGVLDLARFRTDSQELGSKEATGVAVTSVRARDRVTSVRFTVELADPANPDAAAQVPKTRARYGNGQIELVVIGVIEADDLSSLGGLESGAVIAADATHDVERERLRLRIDTTGPRPFWLHTLDSPTRIVLDVHK